MEIKWTQEKRKDLFKRIVDAFGPHEKWNGAEYPRGKREEIEAIYKQFASEMTANGQGTGWKAVRNQVQWALTKQAKENVQPNHMRTLCLGKLAAIQTGLIQPKTLERWFDTSKVLWEFLRIKGGAIESGKLRAEDMRRYFKE